MAETRRLSEREQLKRLLVAESELHRAVLRAQCQRVLSLGKAVLPGKSGQGFLSSTSTWWTLGSALAGWLVARRWKPVLKLVPAAWALWRWWRRYRRG